MTAAATIDPTRPTREERQKFMTALVIGEALIDVVDVRGQPLQRTPGGGPFNVAIGLARLQIPTALLTCVGADSDGDLLLSALDEAGVAFAGERTGSHVDCATQNWALTGRPNTTFAIEWDPHPVGRLGGRSTVWMPCTSGRSGPSSKPRTRCRRPLPAGAAFAPALLRSQHPTGTGRAHEPKRETAWSPSPDTSTW